MPQGNKVVERLRLECAAHCQEIAALHVEIALVSEEMGRPDLVAEALAEARVWRVRAMAHQAGALPERFGR